MQSLGGSDGIATEERCDRSRAVSYALVALVVLIPRLLGLYTFSLFDDAFITFRHAENLATGHGLTFNRGTAVLGTTSPLFAVVLAAAHAIGLSIPATAQAIGILSDVLTAVLAYRFLATGLGSYAASLAVTVFAIDPHIIRVAIGGMESGLFLALSMVILTLLLKGRPGVGLVLASLSLYIRPEGSVLWIACALGVLRRPLDRTSIAYLAGGVTLAAAPLGLIYASYGGLLPQSVAAKGQMRGGGLLGVLRIFLFPAGSPIQTVLTLLAPIGLIVAWSRSRFVQALGLWTGVYVLAYSFSRPPMWTWYGLPVYVAKAAFASLAIARFTQNLVPNVMRTWPRDLIAGVSIATVFAGVMTTAVGTSPIRQHVYEPLQAWCAGRTTERETIAAGDVGAVGYYCDAFIYDLAGLTWPQRLQFKSHLDVVETKKPSYIFAEVSDYWGQLYDPRSDLRQVYEPVIRFSSTGKRSLDIPPAELARGWQQDYVLFRRLDR